MELGEFPQDGFVVVEGAILDDVPICSTWVAPGIAKKCPCFPPKVRNVVVGAFDLLKSVVHDEREKYVERIMEASFWNKCRRT